MEKYFKRLCKSHHSLSQQTIDEKNVRNDDRDARDKIDVGVNSDKMNEIEILNQTGEIEEIDVGDDCDEMNDIDVGKDRGPRRAKQYKLPHSGLIHQFLAHLGIH
ncbi:hypothetical protein Fot_29760 [Forsythia ovata]|uniref:Uncharacterized protein n=1 Tax=Forsythia ovata TaxID=205694 RepID=A0ABD1TST5_9LAMI